MTEPSIKQEIAGYYDHAAAAYARRDAGLKKRFYDAVEGGVILEYCDPRQKRVLDIGTGTGRFAAWVADVAVTVVGVDISQGMIDVARQTHGESDKLRFMQMDCEHTTFPDAAFDLITALGTFEYVDDLSQYLRETGRLLPSGGYLAFTCHNRDAFRLTRPGAYMIHHHSEESVRHDLSAHGFQWVANRSIFFLPGYLVWGGARLLPGRLKPLWVDAMIRVEQWLSACAWTRRRGRVLVTIARRP